MLSRGSAILRSLYGVAMLFPFHDDGRAAVASPQRAAGAVRERQITVLHLNLGVRLAAKLAHGLDHLGDPAAVRGMVVAEPAAVGVERQLARARDQVAV